MALQICPVVWSVKIYCVFLYAGVMTYEAAKSDPSLEHMLAGFDWHSD